MAEGAAFAAVEVDLAAADEEVVLAAADEGEDGVFGPAPFPWRGIMRCISFAPSWATVPLCQFISRA